MNILFLHITDIHIKDHSTIDIVRQDQITKAVKTLGGVDYCFVIYSGDIAFSGRQSEYEVAEEFVRKLTKCLEEELECKIENVIVPGNHDANLADKSRKPSDIHEHFEDGSIDSYFNSDLEQLDSFYSFASKFKSFRNEKVIEIQHRDIDGYRLRIILMNTAPFSLLGKTNEDKSLHYFPVAELDTIKNDDSPHDLTITVMHHPIEWFEDKVKHRLYPLLHEQTDFLFVGHEHFAYTTETELGDTSIYKSTGLALSGTDSLEGFTAVLLDTEHSSFKMTVFKREEEYYRPYHAYNEKTFIPKGPCGFNCTKEFYSEIQHDYRRSRNGRIMDNFVFPSLTNNSKKFDDLKSFQNLVLKTKRINIRGNNRSGKTTLSKYLFIQLYGDYVPLYLTPDDFEKNAERTLINCVERIYNKKDGYSLYLQLKTEQRVLIVDDYDHIDEVKKNTFFEEYSSLFISSILFQSGDCDLDIYHQVDEELSEENEVVNLSISPFYRVKRRELIRKICNTNDYDSALTENIDKEIRERMDFVELTPDFISRYVEFFNSPYYESVVDTNVFSKVYEATITQQINENVPQEDVNEALMILENIAYYCFQNKKTLLETDETFSVMKHYCEEYAIRINYRKMLDNLVDARVLNSKDNNVYFSNISYLSYFTALHINKLDDEVKKRTDIEYVINHVCFYPFDDIFLFLIHVSGSTGIITLFQDIVIKHMENIEIFGFENSGFECLKLGSQLYMPDLPTEEEKREEEKIIEEGEEQVVIHNRMRMSKAFQFSEEDINRDDNQLVLSLRYTELLARILPIFNYKLPAEKKNQIVQGLYQLPNKLIYLLLAKIDRSLVENTDKIVEEFEKQGKTITREKVQNVIKQSCLIVIYSIYSHLADLAVTKKTELYLTSSEYYDFKASKTSKLQNLIFLEKTARFEVFAERSVELDKSEADKDIKQLILLTVRSYFYNHEDPMVGKKQSLAAHFFNKNEQQKIRRQTLRNQSKKS